MPQVFTIPQIKAAEDDAIIYAFKGTCKSFTKYYAADPNDTTSQSMQIATFTEGKDSITVKFRNRDSLPAAWKGKTIWVLANHGDKGWTGVKAKDNERNGEVERILLVTRSAEVGPNPDPARGQSEPAEEAPSESATDQAPARAPAPAAARASVSDPDKARAHMKCELAKYANAMLLVIAAVKHVSQRALAEQGVEIPAEQFQAMCSTFFIKADRQGLIDGLPIKPVQVTTLAKATEAAAKPAPAPKPEPKPEPKPSPVDPPVSDPEPDDYDIPF